MSKFIWQRTRDDQWDYLLIDDKTLGHYENSEQDQGILARIVLSEKNGHKIYRVFMEKNLTLLGDTPWYYLEDLDEEEIISDTRVTVRDFSSFYQSQKYVEKYWDNISLDALELLLDNQFNESEWFGGDSCEKGLIDIFLSGLEGVKWSEEREKEYLTEVLENKSRLQKSYNKYKETLKKTGNIGETK